MRGDAPTDALRYAAAHRQRHISELQDFVRIPSVSADPRHAADVARAAAWLRDHLKRIGFVDARLIHTPGHPFVFAEAAPRTAAPTLLIYGHYDVQPAGPLDAWRTPPFEPTVRGANLFGRGASDNKGQLLAHVNALEAYLRTSRHLPLNVTCLFDGEEEIGSPHLRRVFDSESSVGNVDVAVLSDTRMMGPDRPAITYGLRGALNMEWHVRTGSQDLHSGHFGGAVHNAVHALCEMVAKLHDASGRIAIPGVYDRVRQVGDPERDNLAAAGPSDEALKRRAGVFGLWGERDYSAYERTTIRPALTVNGIQAGEPGAGGRAVIPARATAKVSVRLVPDQDPLAVARNFARYVRCITPPGVRCSVRVVSGSRAFRIDPRQPYVRAAAAACRRVFPQRAVFIRSGGSVPFSQMASEAFGVPTVLMGFALPDDQPHAPNEKFHLPTFARAIETSVWFMHELARLRKVRSPQLSRRGAVPAFALARERRLATCADATCQR